MFLGVDIGGTKTAIALADDAGQIKTKNKTASGLTTGSWPQVLTSQIDQLLAQAKITTQQIKTIGVGVPELIVKVDGQQVTARDYIIKLLQDKYKLPVVVDNDATVAALAELHYGAGQGKKNFIYLILGTGVGGAIVIDGQLYQGTTGRAGEFGHMSVEARGPKCGCGSRGCLHLYASGQSIAQRALQNIARQKATSSKILQLAGKCQSAAELAQKITAEIVFAAAKAGDQVAKETLAEVNIYLGVGIVNLVHLYNPEVIIVGGGMVAAGDLLIKPLNDIIKQCVHTQLFGQVTIVPSALGDEGGVQGAIKLAMLG